MMVAIFLKALDYLSLKQTVHEANFLTTADMLDAIPD